jgi:alpha-glucosidase
MRPMFLEFPDQDAVALSDEEYMFGRSLLVAPKAWPFTDPYFVHLPAGDWYDYWTGAKVAGHSVKEDPPLGALPVFVRAGSIIPQQPVVQNTDERPDGPLTLRVYPGPDCQGALYSDDGNTFGYQKGQFLRLSFTCEAAADHVTVDVSVPEGAYHPWFEEIQLQVYGLKGNIKSVTADGRPVTGTKLASGIATMPPVAWSSAAHNIRIETAAK